MEPTSGVEGMPLDHSDKNPNHKCGYLVTGSDNLVGVFLEDADEVNGMADQLAPVGGTVIPRPDLGSGAIQWSIPGSPVIPGCGLIVPAADDTGWTGFVNVELQSDDRSQLSCNDILPKLLTLFTSPEGA